MEASTSWNPQRLSRPVMGLLYLLPYFSGNQMKEDEMGEACSTRQRREIQTGFWWANLKETGHLENPGIEWSIVLN
jgi:hypothetical protein